MAKPRVLISTDLGGYDNDDAQSMIHALLYANEVDYRGFVMTRTLDGGTVNGVRTSGSAMLREMLAAYNEDLPNLRAHDSTFPSAATLSARIAEGTSNPAWPGTLSAGAQKIISEARAASSGDPLYVLAWGPIHDVAAALLAAPDIVPKVRLFSLSAYGQDEIHTEAYTALVNAVSTDSRYHDLWWINSESTMRGVYIAANGDRIQGITQNLPWVLENATDHGALGDLFIQKYTYDLSTTRTGASSPDGLKMGDTPSLLYLLDNANNDDPINGDSWGGQFREWSIGTNTYTDRTETSLKMGVWNGARTVYEHRAEIYGDFADRFDWAKGTDTGGGDDGSDPPITGARIGLGVTEAESLALAKYKIAYGNGASGGAYLETRYGEGGKGTAYGTFTGDSGEYRFSFRFLNENDGASTYRVYVDDELVFFVRGTGGTGAWESRSDTLHIDKGDVIEVYGIYESGEWARWDNFRIDALTSASALANTASDGFDFL